jgi:hypothetical protein
MMRVLPLILLVGLSSACSPAFDFLVYNASAASVEVFGCETRCTAAPQTACAAGGGTLRVVRGDRAMVFQPNGLISSVFPVPGVAVGEPAGVTIEVRSIRPLLGSR